MGLWETIQINCVIHCIDPLFFKMVFLSADMTICKYHQGCRTDGHFHCPCCDATILRRDDVCRHVRSCDGTAPLPVVTSNYQKWNFSSQEDKSWIFKPHPCAEENLGDSFCRVWTRRASTVSSVLSEEWLAPLSILVKFVSVSLAESWSPSMWTTTPGVVLVQSPACHVLITALPNGTCSKQTDSSLWPQQFIHRKCPKWMSSIHPWMMWRGWLTTYTERRRSLIASQTQPSPKRTLL